MLTGGISCITQKYILYTSTKWQCASQRFQPDIITDSMLVCCAHMYIINSLESTDKQYR